MCEGAFDQGAYVLGEGVLFGDLLEGLLSGGRCPEERMTPMNDTMDTTSNTNTINGQSDKSVCSCNVFELIATVLKHITQTNLV